MLSVQKVSTKRWLILPYQGSVVAPHPILWNQLSFDGAGTKHQREYFKRSIRETLEALISKAETKHGVLGPGTVYGKQRRLWSLATWMAKRGIWRFSQLQAIDIAAYLTEAVERKSSLRTGLCVSSVRAILTSFRDIWQVRHCCQSGLRVDPDEVRELRAILHRAKGKGIWTPIPIEEAKSLLHDAIQWMRNAAPLTAKLYLDAKLCCGSSVGRHRSSFRKSMRHAYAEVARAEEYSQLAAWVKEESGDVVTTLRTAAKLTDGAAIVLILLLTGIRISELRSLRAQCVTFETHDTGRKYSYINGVAAKKKGTPRRWIVPELVVETIATLQQFHVSKGGTTENEFLFRTSSGNGTVMNSTRRMTLSSYSTLRNLFCKFALSPHRDAPTSPSQRLHPHQCRKTFARFVMCRDKRSLGALVEHYGHLYGSVLDGAYVGADIELGEILDEEGRQDLARGLMDLLTTKALAGKAGETFLKIRKNLEAGTRFKGKTAIETVVSQMISRGIRLAPCDWGYCLYEEETSACRGNASGPDPVNRCPSTCSTCKNFIVTENYRGWWEERFRREELFCATPDLPQQTKKLTLSRLSETVRVLKDLNFSNMAHSEAGI